VFDGPSDRACLENHIDKVLAAMIGHDPGRLVLAWVRLASRVLGET